jgi:hypothetical protein
LPKRDGRQGPAAAPRAIMVNIAYMRKQTHA